MTEFNLYELKLLSMCYLSSFMWPNNFYPQRQYAVYFTDTLTLYDLINQRCHNLAPPLRELKVKQRCTALVIPDVEKSSEKSGPVN